MIDLTKLPPADLTYLKHCVAAGRILPRGRKKPTRFVEAWLSKYADENDGVVYLKKERRLENIGGQNGNTS